MANIPPRFDVTRADIARVVARFYTQVRAHPMLGPVFAVHISDWPPHEEKITRFWCNAILHDRVYDGNPMMVHKQAGNVQPGMFSTWLGLFDSVLQDELDPAQAAGWSELAHRIGRSLRAGVSDVTPAGQVPNLR